MMKNVISVSDVKDRILATTHVFIQAHSYAEASVQEICQQAGIKQTSFYRFFPTKQDLSLEILEHAWITYKPLLEDAFHDDVLPLDRLERYLKMDFEYQRQASEGRYSPYSDFIRELSQQDAVCQRRLIQMYNDIRRYMESALREAVSEGYIPDVDVPTAASAMLAYIQGLSIVSDAYQAPQLHAQLTSCLMRLALPNTLLHQALTYDSFSHY